jgi:protoporphyrinogen oxidase
MAVFEVTARWDSDLWGSSDSEIIRKVREDAISTGLVQPDDIADAFAHRVPYTYPLYTSDFTDRLYRVFSALEKIPNLVSTGRQGLFNHNNMDHSMLMGIRAAEYVASEKEVAHRWVSDLDQFSHFRIVD